MTTKELLDKIIYDGGLWEVSIKLGNGNIIKFEQHQDNDIFNGVADMLERVEYVTKKQAKKAEEAIKMNAFECVQEGGFWIVNGDVSYSIEYYKTAKDAIAEYKKDFERISA